MGPSTQLAVLGAVVLAVVVVAAAVAASVSSARAGRRRQAALDLELARSRAEVELLGQRLAELTEQVAGARRAETRRAEAEHREYVITTLASDPDVRRGSERALAARSGPAVGRVLEDQLVGVLARQQDLSPRRGRVVDVVVRTVALGHGVRRALSPDNLDRAGAEAHVARRRSRRTRRREVREARRLVRSVRSSPGSAEEDAA